MNIKIRNAIEHHPEVQAISRFLCLYQFGPFEISPLLRNFFVVNFFDIGWPECISFILVGYHIEFVYSICG